MDTFIDLLRDPDIIKVTLLSVVLSGIALTVMARDSARGSLSWKRALSVVVLVTLGIFAASALVLGLRGGPYSVMHGGNGPSHFIALMIIQVVPILPIWLVVGSIAAVVLVVRSARVAHANGIAT